MTVLIQACKFNPNGVEEIRLDNVASFTVDDNQVLVSFNGEPDQVFPMTNNADTKPGEWFVLSIVAKKIALNPTLGS